MDALGTQDSPRVSRSARRLRGPTRATAPRHPSCLTIKQGAPCQLPVKLAPVSLSASQELPPSRSADEDSRERAAAHATVPAPRRSLAAYGTFASLSPVHTCGCRRLDATLASGTACVDTCSASPARLNPRQAAGSTASPRVPKRNTASTQEPAKDFTK